MFATTTGALPHVKSGALRLLAAAGKDRNPFAPDAPTIGETVPGHEAASRCGVGVPRGTPADIIAKLNRGLSDPATRARLAAASTTPIIHTPESFGAFMASEVEKWGKVIRTAGIKRV